MNRLVIGVFVVLAVVAAALTITRQTADRAEEARIVAAERRGVTSRVLAQGKVRARTQVDVSSEVAGRVAEVNVEVGDVVKVGDPLFSLDGEQLRSAAEQLHAAVAGAEAVLARADVALAEAERAVNRDQKLVEQGVVTRDAFQLSESRLLSARADRAQAAANVERARIDLGRSKDALRRARVTAPQAGTVVAVGVEVGRVVSSSTGLSASPDASLGLGIGGMSAPVVIADLSELIVKLDVDELDISRVQVGQHAIVRAQGLKDIAFDGVVEKVGLLGKDALGAVLFSVDVKVTGSRPDIVVDGVKSAATDHGTGDAGVDGAAAPVLPAPATVLRSGMSAQAEIEVERLDDVVVVPVAAVLEAQETDDGHKPDRVVVVEGGEGADAVLIASVRPLKLGPSEGDVIAVLGGIKAGERVVEGPYRVLKGLKDGDTVRAAPTSEADKDARGDANKGANKDANKGANKDADEDANEDVNKGAASP